MKEAIIFDMDGVLVDSQPLHFEADMITLLGLGAEARYDDVVMYAGMATMERMMKYKSAFKIELDARDMAREHENVMKEIVDGKKNMGAIDGVIPLLDLLKNERKKLAVASSSSYEFVYMMLDKIKIREYFDIVTSGEDMNRSKPSPEIFLKTAEKINCAPELCVVIEDSTNGVLAANAANMRCVGYMNKNSGGQDLSKADVTVTSFRELMENTAWLL